jgi:ATP-binding cassette subfamily F protein uup
LAKGGSISAAKFLELFLFTPEKQYTYIQSLSGGEKKRLQLLTVLFKNPNFLILDEPTNDLDLPTLGVLENFLQDYPGCVLIVSHDRYFMDKLVDHLFVFEGDGVIKDFAGNYSQYRDEIEQKQELKQQSKKEEQATITINTSNSKPKISYKYKREFELLETEIPALENAKKELENQLGDSNLSYQEMQTISLRIGEIQSQLDEKEFRWLELSEMVE